MKLKPEDFAGYIWTDGFGNSHYITEEDAVNVAEIANNRIVEILKDSLTVSAEVPDHPRWQYETVWEGVYKTNHNMVGQLVNLQDIIVLGDGDMKLLVDTIENPPESNEALKKAMGKK